MLEKLLIIDIGSGELNSDWLKLLDDGKWQKEDLRAHEKSAKQLGKTYDERISGESLEEI